VSGGGTRAHYKGRRVALRLRRRQFVHELCNSSLTGELPLRSRVRRAVNAIYLWVLCFESLNNEKGLFESLDFSDGLAFVVDEAEPVFFLPSHSSIMPSSNRDLLACPATLTL
jgi:hypothetical protein